MKLNNKGFALTSIIYMLIVLFLMIMLLILANLAQRKVVLDKLKYDVKEKLNQTVSINAQNLPYQNTTTGIFYETLSDALNNSDDGNTIKVLKDVKEIASAMNTKGTTSNPVVLDLNGKTIDYIGNEKTVILNTGNLEIKDTASNGKITTSTIMGNGRVIHNKTDGNFTLTSGKLEVAAPSSANAIIAEGKTVTINGGEISVASEVDSAIVIEIDNTFLKINNGILHSEGYGVYNRTGKIEINGGNISSNKKATITNNSTLGNTQEDPVLKITGGTISSTGNYAINNTKANTTLYLSGGNISSTGDHALVSNGHLVMTNGIIDAYSGCGIYITGNEGAEVSGGIITKKINPITNEWVGGATFQITGSGTTTIKGNTIVQNEEGNTSNVIYNGGTGTIIVDENATIENKSATVIGTNASTGKIIVKNGTLKSNGGYVLYNPSTGTIEVQSGTLSTSGSNSAIMVNSGTVTIGSNDGSTPSQTIPSITGGTYGVSAATAATFNFYDGKIIGANGKSISKTPNNIPSGTQVIKTTSGSNEIATLKPIFVTDGAATVLDASNHGSGTTWTALTGANGTVNNATWGTNYLEFNGTNSYVNLGRMDYSEQTVEATISIDETPAGTGYFIGNIDGGGVGLAVMQSRKIAVLFATKKADGTSYNYNNATSQTILEPGKKYHICMTYDGSKIRLYINGILDFEKTPVHTTPVNTTGNTIMALGGNPTGNIVNAERFKGKIYTAAVYNRALSTQEIKQNAMAGMYVAGESINTN